MKNLLIALSLGLFSQQLFAITIVGKDFGGVANALVGSSGVFEDNDPTQTPEQSITDTNAASFVMSGDSPAYLDLSFDVGVFDGTGADLSILFVGDGAHSVDLTLFNQGGTASSTLNYAINVGGLSGDNYTGHFVDNNMNGIPDDGVDYGIFFMDVDLADFSFLGTDVLGKLRLDASGFSAVPSLVGVYPSAVVPVPAAVWLFGSGLIALVGVMRRRR